MTTRVRRGQMYQDLDPRRPDRIGTVVHLGHATVKMRWNNSGYTTAVRRRDLELGECNGRGYVMIRDAPAQEQENERPPRAAAMTEFDANGVRWWICSMCGAKGRLRGSWRVLLYNDLLDPQSVVICSDACHEARRRATDVPARTAREPSRPTGQRRSG